MNIFRIALANKEHNGRGVRCAVVVKFGGVAVLNKTCIFHRVHISFQCQRDDIGFQTVGNLQRLFAGAAVRLNNVNALTRLLLPMLFKCFVVLLVQLAGRVVRNVCNLYGITGSGTAVAVSAAACQKANAQSRCQKNGRNSFLIIHGSSPLYQIECVLSLASLSTATHSFVQALAAV